MNRRAYSMDTRAQGIEQNRVQIQQAVLALAERQRLADIPLTDIAEFSGVSVRTLLRYYGSKDQLLRTVAEELQAVMVEDRPPTPDDVRAALAGLADHYETRARLVLMLLAQEDADTIAAFITKLGKAYHRQWVARVFRLHLERDADLVDQLVVATDVYAWKLLHLDRGLSKRKVVQRMTAMVRAICASSDRTAVFADALAEGTS